MKTTVKKWGNSAALRIPSTMMRAADIEVGAVVQLREDHGRLVIEPVRENAYRLADQ